MSHTDRSNERFTTTRWSLVMHPVPLEAASSRRALLDLCERYWYPVYAYLRHRDLDSAEAREAAMHFLQRLFSEFSTRPDFVSKQGFRSFLLARLDDFVDRADVLMQVPAVAEISSPPEDLELRMQQDTIGAASAELAYQRSYAVQVFTRTFERLRREAEQTGHADLYEALEPFLSVDPTVEQSQAIATRLNCKSLLIVVALKRLRERFRKLASDELADTVGSAEGLVAEQEALFSILQDWQSS